MKCRLALLARTPAIDSYLLLAIYLAVRAPVVVSLVVVRAEVGIVAVPCAGRAVDGLHILHNKYTHEYVHACE